MVKTHKKNVHTKSFARMTAYRRGIMYGLALVGFTMQEIVDEVEKPDGSSPDLKTVRGVLLACEANGGMAWDGASVQSKAGRPRTSTDEVDKKIVALVFRMRGSAKVTSEFVRKLIPSARKLSARSIRRRLADAGLKWLTRRRKTLVPKMYKTLRMEWAEWVFRRTATTLAR